MKIYHVLVNKHHGISRRYHKMHDNATGIFKVVSWLYLFWLNFAYYCLFLHYLDNEPELSIYETKRLKINESESIKALSPGDLAEKLAKYDVVSFDIFDTLIYRPFSSPTDLFYLIGIELEYMDFARIRCEAEYIARKQKLEEENHTEVTLDDIWKVIESKTGIDSEAGKRIEIQYEKEFCYSNEYMLEVYKILKQRGKKIIFTSDMYLPSESITDILTTNKFEAEELYLSCELKKSKSYGDIYEYIKERLGTDLTYIHIGDNHISDVVKAQKASFSVHEILNPNIYSDIFRAYDMSPIIGGAYRGIVNNRLYNGIKQYSRYYEYGFIYGGIFVLGYCSFIHKYCLNHNINKVFFLARDGEIVKKVYNMLFPDEKTEYILFSRVAACKLSAAYNKYDYLKKMVYHKVNKGHTFNELLMSMELDDLISTAESADIDLELTLTSDSIQKFLQFIETNWNRILDLYKPQREAAAKYFSQYVNNGDRIAIVDIGWAGTGAIALRNLIRKEWKYDAEVIGIVAGTNTINNSEPYMSEGYIQNGTIVSYMYSSSINRDLWKKHDCSKGHNLFFELLLSSESPSFLGFYPSKYGSYDLKFKEKEKNSESIIEIQNGIIAFVEDYIKFFGKYSYMLNISGRDSYAPMLVAMSFNDSYLKDIYKDFDLNVDIGK